MKNPNPTTPISASEFQMPATAIACALLLLVCALPSQSAKAQDTSPRPVARLISTPAEAAECKRPRRVSQVSTDTVAAAAESSIELKDVHPIERRAFEQTNQVRVKNGLAPLTWDGELWRLARAHSEHMALQKFFAHETPGGLQLRDRARASQIRFRVIGENIAYNKGYDDPGGFAVERWMISSGHRANILYAGFQSAAIGSYVAADGSTYLTQVFITR